MNRSVALDREYRTTETRQVKLGTATELKIEWDVACRLDTDMVTMLILWLYSTDVPETYSVFTQLIIYTNKIRQ